MLEGDAETPTRMVGAKKVPILEKEDGSHMPESMDIVRYLEEQNPPAKLTAPDDSVIEEWLGAHSQAIFELSVPRFTRADFPELATPEARDYYTKRMADAFGDLDALIAETPERLEALKPALDALEARLAERPEDTLGMTDIRLLPVLRCLTIVKGLELGPATAAYVERVAAASKVPNLFDRAI